MTHLSPTARTLASIERNADPIANTDSPDTIVFLHAGNVAGWMWGEQLPAFPDHHLLIPDLPGYGASNHLDWVSLAEAADRVADLIRARAHGGRAHIVGLSLGSSVALELAARHPHCVRSAFLASASVTPSTRAERLLGQVVLRFWERRWLWTLLAHSYRLPADAAAELIATGLGIRRITAVRVFDEVWRGMPKNRLRDVAAPTLVVAGQRDSATVAEHSLRALADALPDGRTATAPGMHHQWNIEDVDLFNDALHDWIDNSRVSPRLVASVNARTTGR